MHLERPLDRAATLRRFALPAVVCSALLLTAYVRTAEGARHPSPWGYRVWSFGALTYSDILALHEDRGAGRHSVPYLQDRIEYPVLLGLSMWWPSLIAPGREGYFTLTVAALALCALGCLYVIAATPRAKPWAFAASPALLPYAALNWDLLALLPLFVGVWLWARQRERTATAVLALAVWTKIFPALALGVLWLGKPLKRLLPHLALVAAISIAVNVPFALGAHDNWSWFFEYSRIREIEPSLYLLLGCDAKDFAPAANLIGAAATVAAALAITGTEWRTRRLDALRAACALFCVFFFFNKVFSPQYWIWVVALAALAALPGWLCSAVSVIALFDFAISFSRLHLQTDRVWFEVAWFERSVFWPMVALRYAALGACAAWAFAHILAEPSGAQEVAV
jgi:hypothetical protein